MDINAVVTIARQELVINIRNRWTTIFALVFGGLALAIFVFRDADGGRDRISELRADFGQPAQSGLVYHPARRFDDGRVELHQREELE